MSRRKFTSDFKVKVVLAALSYLKVNGKPIFSNYRETIGQY